ncbi:MAG: hypothetical protein JJ927_07555 [Balneola sp.]|nr:hypothetical protein [Balneola sp.]MBO6650864.1 hypothetical protein [Balneola sp.]
MGEKIFPEQTAPLFKGMGNQHFTLESESEMAEIFFNQAIALTFGFNHLEAERSFKQVAELDSKAAIAFWGQALVLGPNINTGMESSAVIPAYNAIQKARKLAKYSSKKEQALIEALSARYSKDETLSDRHELDIAYSEALKKVAKEFPNDPDVLTFLSEALMVIHAWDYWEGDGRPKEWTPEILRYLEHGLSLHPEHPGLIHYYIHAVEASKTPGRAKKYADRLAELIPGSGHIVHMPSHIYIRTGEYQKGVLINEKAIEVDNTYITQCRSQGLYPLAYVPHNRHFLWAMATLQGASEKAIKAAEHMSEHTSHEIMRMPGLGTLQHYWVTPWYAYVRFGKWDKILNLKKPDSDLLYPVGVWHYARGIAFTGKDKLQEARKELSALKATIKNEALKDITVWEINDASSVLQIAALTLEGEIEAKARKYGLAVSALQKAIALEDKLNYNEPSDWHYPVRQSLGAVLLEAGYFNEAEEVYRKDLETFPKNGWSLFGLWKSLKGQGKSSEATEVYKQFRESWKWADFELKSSRVI